MGDSRRAHLVHSVQFGAGCWSGAGANRLEDLIPSRLGQGAGDARKLPACHSPGFVGCHRFPKVRPIGFQCLASPLSQDQLRACAEAGRVEYQGLSSPASCEHESPRFGSSRRLAALGRFRAAVESRVRLSRSVGDSLVQYRTQPICPWNACSPCANTEVLFPRIRCRLRLSSRG